jgi:hypothetical protein
MKRILFFLLAPFLLLSPSLFAQDGNNPVSYSNLALQFSTQNYKGDAATGLFPTVANVKGLGSFLDNPASMALVEKNYFNFSIGNNQFESENAYLSNSITTEDNSTNLGSMGVVYKFPTVQGSFVLGAGYNRIKNQNMLARVDARNNQSTITDAFREPTSDYQDIAFNTYAIDWGDTDSTYLESIFRIGLPNYPGIDQNAEISYETNMSEYSIFFGTEFKKNLYVGASAGIIGGTYSYRRNFLESDSQNDYNANFVPSDAPNQYTDIDNILTHDKIDADILGFSVRAGLIYQFSPRVNVGISYLVPSTIVVREDYYSSIKTELDDNSSPFISDFASDETYEYRIKKPGRLSAGFALQNMGNFSLAVSGELVNYANLRLDLVSGNDMGYDEKVAVRQNENDLDAFMKKNYRMAFNLKTSLGYQIDDIIHLNAGYAFFQGKSKVFEADRNVVSGGFSTNITNDLVFDLNGQYSFWDDRFDLYNYYDYSSNVARSETVNQNISNFKIIAGLRFMFN